MNSHKILLAASSGFFRNHFSSTVKTEPKAQVELEHELFEKVLRFVYFSEVVVDNSDLEEFMAALQKLEMVEMIRPKGETRKNAGKRSADEDDDDEPFDPNTPSTSAAARKKMKKEKSENPIVKQDPDGEPDEQEDSKQNIGKLICLFNLNYNKMICLLQLLMLKHFKLLRIRT
jgi:hypothetical protein